MNLTNKYRLAFGNRSLMSIRNWPLHGRRLNAMHSVFQAE